MRKLIKLLVVTMLLFSVMAVNAKVRYEEKDSKWTCIITYKNNKMSAVNCIGTMTNDWEEPGKPMVRNAQGEWEYRFVMEKPIEYYKFYNPNDGLYFEDPEMPEFVFNSFGTKDGVLRHPKTVSTSITQVKGTQEMQLPYVAVSTFDITAGAVNSEEADAITELFIAELVSTGKVNVVDRANFDKTIKEMKFQASDWSNKEKTVALGNAINATMVARGQIIKLGSRMYLSSTVIDLKTAVVLSSSKKQFGSIDDIFDLLPTYTKDIVDALYTPIMEELKKTLKIGDIGPGGGIVFYIEGTRALEVSANLGSHDWYTACEVAKSYKGGGYEDWYLPTKEELNLIYQNLIKTGYLKDYKWHWSSTPNGSNNAVGQSFSDGGRYYANCHLQCFGWPHKDYVLSVRAIRAF